LNEEHKTDHPELRLAVGARLIFADGTPDILAIRRTAPHGGASRLLTVGKSRGEKAECILFFDDLIEHIAGLNLIVMPPIGSRPMRLRPSGTPQRRNHPSNPSTSPPACFIMATMRAAWPA